MKNTFDVSRRNFLKGVGVAAVAGAGAAALAGCGSPSTSGSAAAEAETTGTIPAKANMPASIWALDEVGEPTETVEADVVIIGGGGTGMAAAIEATELGLNTVLIEKAGELGGAFVATEGMFGVGIALAGGGRRTRNGSGGRAALRSVPSLHSFHQTVQELLQPDRRNHRLA